MDLECYRNYFCCGIKNYDTKEILFYEISEEKNELDLIYNWFSNYTGYLITFNGLHYDEPLIKYFLNNYNKYKNWRYLEICDDLKTFSDKIILTDFDEEVSKFRFIKTNWTSIDLMAYWSKMLRMSKKISLKSLGIQLGYHTVQELPYTPNSILTIQDLPKLRYYNYTHDLGILELLVDKMKDDVKLRANIVKEYSLDCWSWDAPKIASEALLKNYVESKYPNDIKNKYSFYNRLKEVRNLKFFKEEISLNKILKGFDPQFKLPIFQNLWVDILNSKNSFSKELLVNKNNTSIRLTYGIGGLHSINENESYFSNENLQVVTSDVASLYPNLIINYECIRFPEVLNQYISIKDERIIAKKAKLKEKDTFFKLILNSTSGLLDNQHSWLYYPEGAMKLRLIGQLILTKCIEVCIINNWQVVSANTDGIEVLVPHHQLQQYKDILDMTCRKFNLDLEHEYYEKIIYKNVNNYLAKTTNGDVKRKGFFKIPINEKGQKEIPLGDSVNEIVISKALHNYYVNNIEPREYISNPEKYDLHIYDYCKSNKIGKDFRVYYNNEIQQQLNRYYFSKKGSYLFKQKKSNNYIELDRERLEREIINNDGDGGLGYHPDWKPLTKEQIKKKVDDLIHGNATMQHVNVNQPILLFNNFEEKSWNDYQINYNYYISKVNKIIDEINRNNQLTLF